MEKKRSVGVTIFSWLLIIIAVMIVLSTGIGLGVLIFGRMAVPRFLEKLSDYLIWWGGILVLVSYLIPGILLYMTGRRLLLLRKEAKKHIIYLSYFLIIIGLLGPGIILVPIFIIAIIFFTRPKVKEQFNKE